MRLASAAQMKELDRRAIEERKIPSLTLMERAAEHLAARAEAFLEKREPGGQPGPYRIAVLCGPGNNGGDGAAAARLLAEKGMKVRAFLVGNRQKMTADTKEMERRLLLADIRLEDWQEQEDQREWCRKADLILDAILGIGLKGNVREETDRVLKWLSGLSVPVVAADIPSGIDADTGAVLGTVLPAALTVTFTLPKFGHFEGQGAYYRGELAVCSIGIPEDLTEELFREEQVCCEVCDFSLAREFLPERRKDGHKGTFGKVTVIGGSVGLSGAPVLASRGAARCGSGLVYLGVPESIYPAAAASCLEVMVSPLPQRGGKVSSGAFFQILERLNGGDAGLIGQGLGRSRELSLLVCRLLEQTETPLVLDADALYAIKDRKEVLKRRSMKGLVTVITPHEGEFARLGGDTAPGRREAAFRFAREYGCITVLKGPGTVTASPDGKIFVNATGNNGMAKGGSGDVLGGMILSFLGQGMEPVRAAALAVYLHGRAGDLCREELGEYGMLPGDLTERIPAAILELQRG